MFVFQLSAFILRTTPKHWPNAIPELLFAFQPAQVPSIPPDKALWILLEVLTVIPEEVEISNVYCILKM